MSDRGVVKNQKLEYSLQLQQAMGDISLRALQMGDLETFFRESLGLICEALDASHEIVLEVAAGEDLLRMKAGLGWEVLPEGGVSFGAQTNTMPGYTLIHKETLALADIRGDVRFLEQPILRENGIAGGITALIPGRGQPYGVLGVYTSEARQFEADEVQFVQSAAHILAAAIIQKKVEEQDYFSRDQLAVILQSVADGITVQDANGRLIYANEAAARATGFESQASLLAASPAEIFSRFEMFTEEGGPFPVDNLPGRLVVNGLPEAQAVIGFRIIATGERRWSIVKARPVFSQEGRKLTVNIFQDITAIKENEESQRFIAETGKIFASSLDYETTLQNVADLAAHSFADWCTISLLENGELKNVAVAHINAELVKWVREMEETYPPDINDPYSAVVTTIQTGQAQFFPVITREMIEQSPRDRAYKDMMLSLGIRSAMVLPLAAHGQTFGALTMIWAESGRQYSQVEVNLAEELSRQASVAIDNARLYREVQEANSELERRVQQRTDQLQTVISKLRNEISERKRAQGDLGEKDVLLEGLFEAAPDATLLVDRDGIVVRVNARTETMFGCQREDIIGDPVDNLFPLHYRYIHKNYRLKLLSDPTFRQEGGSVELYGRRSDGSDFPVEVVLSPVQTKDGLQTISAIRDVTERKKMEAELAEVQRRLVDSLEAERLRLAQEIHDGAIQDLYGVIYALKGLEDALAEQDEAGRAENLSTGKAAIQDAITELRTICGELRPPALGPFGLQKAIQAHLDQLGEKYPALTIHHELMADDQRLPEDMRMGMYRIYQHAVSNVIRHAQAQNLWVRFDLEAEQIKLEIRDDGVGFLLPKRWVELARQGHLGLIGTVERAEAIGAQLSITSEPGKGTSIQVILPQGKPVEPAMGGANLLQPRK